MKIEGRKIVDLARPHTRIHISLYHILISHLLPLRHWKHLMVVSYTCEDEKSATEFPPLSQIPASLALRRRRRRWNVKSGSTTADATWQTIAVADERFLSLANRYNLKYHVNAKIYILRFRGMDWEWRTGTSNSAFGICICKPSMKRDVR